jgi:hypothetical protein
MLIVATVRSLAIHAGVLLVWPGRVPTPDPSPSTSPKQLHLSLFTQPVGDTKNVAKVSPFEPVHHDRLQTEPMYPPPRSRTKAIIAANPGGAIVANAPVAHALAPRTVPEKTLASMATPPPPTAEEWQLASTYTLKNSKRYRYAWGQQIRSMMGTVVEGPQQGYVRFRIELAGNGKITKVETLWSTSDIAEKLARQAMNALVSLPPTPTGRPLVFEQTIAYEPFDSGWPPIYKNDCLPDPPVFHNPFVWDGSSPQANARIAQKDVSVPIKQQANEGCPNDAQPDSIEAEAADSQRQLDQWSVRPLNGVN